LVKQMEETRKSHSIVMLVSQVNTQLAQAI